MNEVATKLRRLGVKGVLIDAAEQGYIAEAACGMERCYCPDELGGRSHFVPLTDGWSDWNPTHEHAPIAKRDGGPAPSITQSSLIGSVTRSTSRARPACRSRETSSGCARRSRRAARWSSNEPTV